MKQPSKSKDKPAKSKDLYRCQRGQHVQRFGDCQCKNTAAWQSDGKHVITYLEGHGHD